MNKRLNYIFLIAGFTATGIIFCQLYWVYYNYTTARKNFIQTATYTLRQSIDEYQLAQNHLPSSLMVKEPTLSFLVRTTKKHQGTHLDTPNAKESYQAEFSTVTIDELHLQTVKTLLARLISQQKRTFLYIDTLDNIFHKNLRHNNIKENFILTCKRFKASSPTGDVSVRVNFYKYPVIVTADLANPTEFLLKNNFLPALISSILIILSAGSFFYMGGVIKRQLFLDQIKTNFINNISHELRTPITILKSSNEALTSFGAAKDINSLNRYLQINKLVIDELDVNIERILEFGKSEQGKLKPAYEKINFCEIEDQVKTRFNLHEGVSIASSMETSPFEIVTDKYMIRIILTNLIDNAIKFSPGTAIVKIETIKFGSKWQLRISDQGRGIPAADLPYIFEKFYRVGSGDLQDVKGYGIGLSYVRELVLSLKGKISVTSEVGRGTIFTILFNS